MDRDKIREVLRSNCTLTNVNNYAALIMDKGKADCLNDLIVALSQLKALMKPKIDGEKILKGIRDYFKCSEGDSKLYVDCSEVLIDFDDLTKSIIRGLDE